MVVEIACVVFWIVSFVIVVRVSTNPKVRHSLRQICKDRRIASDVPPVVFWVFGVIAFGLLITNPWLLLLIVVVAVCIFAVGYVFDLIEDLCAKRRDRKEKGRDSRLR